MDNLKEVLAPKTFNKFSHAAVLIWFLICAIFLGIFIEVENAESRFDFRCGGAKSGDVDLVRGKCFVQYQEQYNKYGIPTYGFVVMNFLVIGIVCAMYSLVARSTVDRLSLPSTRNGDPESQSSDQKKETSTGKQLFIAYCCQLSIRIVLGVLFMILQTQLLYPSKFPYTFGCYFNSGTEQPRNLSDASRNSTFHECNNQRAVKKIFWMNAVLAVNGIYVACLLIETVYILARAWKVRSFMENSKFLEIHLDLTNERSHHVLLRLRLHENRVTHFKLLLEPQKQDDVVSLKSHECENRLIKVKLHVEPQKQDDVVSSKPQECENRLTQVELHLKPQKQDVVVSPKPQECAQRLTQVALHIEPQKEDNVVPPKPRDQIESHQELPQPDGRNGHDNVSQRQREPEQPQTSKLQPFIAETKEIIKEDTQNLFELRSPFSAPPGEHAVVTHLTLDQIYTNLVVIPDRATYDFTENREEQLKVYPRSCKEESQLKSLEDLLNDESKKVLVVGRPGIGKTLCCTKLLRDWAFDKVFQATTNARIHFDAAFFLKFRRLNSLNDLSLRELLTQSEHCPSDHLDDEVWKYILEHPEGVLILLDGFDEFKDNANMVVAPPRPKSTEEKMPLQILYQWLVTGKLLKGASILTTTRPTALASIVDLPFDKTFEILGFSTEQIEEYVYKFTGDDKQAGETLWRHISSNMNLLSLCYIPVNSFIMCSSLSQILQLDRSAGVTLPSKLTTIYKIAVKVFYYKHTKEFRDRRLTREHFVSDKLPENVEETFEKLGRVAFEGIKEGKLIIEGKKVREMEDSALFHRLPDRPAGELAYERQFCFIHLTMQEFFASRHLANMSETELRNFVNDNIKDGKWQLVLQFLAGLMEDKDHIPGEIMTDLLPAKTEEKQSAEYNEDWPQNENKMKVTCWPTDDEQDLAVTLSVDCSALVNVIKNVPNISHLDLSLNNINLLGCLEVCKLLKCRKSQLTWLHLRQNQLTDEAAKYLAEAITNNNCQLRALHLLDNNIGDTGTQHFAEAINNNNCQLRWLALSANYITDTGAQHLAEAINNNNSQLSTLNLSHNNITDTGAQHLAEAINNINSQLKTLNLARNDITATGAQHLAEAIHNNCQLHTLNICYNKITDTGAQHLAEAINNKNCQLRVLNLSSSNMTDTGAHHLAEAISNHNCQLRTLYLYNNKITEAGRQNALSLVSKSQSMCALCF
ncbi:NACHT, LRR and PYD domains-containing protein 3 [Stylophora pistillata]|uniref:NACHT, LRR and PYD domains-containing protein 3 n=1 Tax=Stylophora pistillata TaxID=50429 RepID=A0A2B4SKX8_STYPI|nr:NACHT, LRR and PYD domains-containing protein 3 [Stylophora pistillata]